MMFLLNLFLILIRPQYWRIFFLSISRLFRERSTSYDIVFFFPFYHIGGAEKVHIDILRALPTARKLVIFTSTSKNSMLLSDFSNEANIVDLGFCLSKKYLYFFTFRFLISVTNKIQPTYVFGCNSRVYYNMLPKIRSEIIKFDLIHAFSDSIDSAEYWSLSVIQHLDKRVCISQKTIDDLSKLYSSNGILRIYINNVIFISNGIKLPKHFTERDFFKERLDVIYVGRNSPEKRIHIIENVSNILKEHDIYFSFVGFEREETYINNTRSTYFGEIVDMSNLQNLYIKSDVLILSSYREGFPMVVMEAMSYGCIPLCTAVGDIPNRLVNNTNALFVESNSELVITNFFVEMLIKLRNDKQLRRALSINAFELSKQFDICIFNKKYQEIFNLMDSSLK